MNLHGSDGSSFQLTILGYQFPYLATFDEDANWLITRVNVTCPRGSWQADDPCLLTWEVARLASWLEGVADNTEQELEAGFVEPNLLFRVEGASALRVYFELECRPEWLPWTRCPQRDVWVEFPLAEVDLHSAAVDLRSQLNQFPVRRRSA